MAETEQPQLYLVTPAEFELSGFSRSLARILDKRQIACVRLSMASRSTDRISRNADALREICHARDVALVIDTHLKLVEPLGLDGVHLPDGARSVRAARKELGADAIVGAFCGVSRHDGMTAGEAGADYVAFGPAGQSALGAGSRADPDLFAWWSEMIEIPVVAEGALSEAEIKELSAVTDFFAIGEEIWESDSPEKALERLLLPLDQIPGA